jgi:amino acid transporter
MQLLTYSAVIVTSASSSANAFLFIGARYLFGLAQNNQAPRIFLKCTEKGVPIYGVCFTALFSGLAYVTLAADGSTAFGWFISLGTVAVLFNWCSVCVTYLRFRRALELQGVDRNTLVFKAPLQPYGAWFALIYFIVVIFSSGYEIFTNGRWSTTTFVTTYIGIPLYFGLLLLWKVWKRTSLVKPAEADIWSGKAALDAIVWPEVKPRNVFERIWFWIC